MAEIANTETWRKLSVAFYARVDRDPRIRHLFGGKNFHCAIEELTAFLVQLFGGPSEDSQRRWWLSLRESHQRFKIGQAERAAWMENMVKALDDARIEEPLHSSLRGFFDQASAHVVNSGEAVPVAQGPAVDAIAQRWKGQLGLDEAVAAVRAGEAERAMALADSSLMQNRSVFAGVLGLMMGSGNAVLLEYIQGKLSNDPGLLRERYAGRTLLHVASGLGNLAMVEFLLRLGADVHAKDGGNHTPLYSVANECHAPGGERVVRALVKAGADVNANEGVKHCTALHMAARRGNVEIAEELLECGAYIDARDSLGDTPLRRAVNCNKIQVAELLLTRKASVRSIGNKGLTPLLAARNTAMKELLRSRGA